jgi:hypothetical protein
MTAIVATCVTTRSAPARTTPSRWTTGQIGPREVRLTGSLLEPTEIGPDGFLIRGRVERPGHFQQEREIRYDPGISLTIADTLTASGDRTYVSSLHLAPDLEPQPTDSGFVIDLDDKHIRIDLESEDCSLSSVRGQEDPLLGWHSSREVSLAPTSVLRAICPGQERQIVWNVSLQ